MGSSSTRACKSKSKPITRFARIECNSKVIFIPIYSRRTSYIVSKRTRTSISNLVLSMFVDSRYARFHHWLLSAVNAAQERFLGYQSQVANDFAPSPLLLEYLWGRVVRGRLDRSHPADCPLNSTGIGCRKWVIRVRALLYIHRFESSRVESSFLEMAVVIFQNWILSRGRKGEFFSRYYRRTTILSTEHGRFNPLLRSSYTKSIDQRLRRDLFELAPSHFLGSGEACLGRAGEWSTGRGGCEGETSDGGWILPGCGTPQGPLTNLPAGKKPAWYASLVRSIGRATSWAEVRVCEWRVSCVTSTLSIPRNILRDTRDPSSSSFILSDSYLFFHSIVPLNRPSFFFLFSNFSSRMKK